MLANGLAGATGFVPIELHYLNLVGYFGWWANAKIFKRTEQSATQIATFDKLIVPWLRPLESAIRPPVNRRTEISVPTPSRTTRRELSN